MEEVVQKLCWIGTDSTSVHVVLENRTDSFCLHVCFLFSFSFSSKTNKMLSIKQNISLSTKKFLGHSFHRF
jgi:hypothetical protein